HGGGFAVRAPSMGASLRNTPAVGLCCDIKRWGGGAGQCLIGRITALAMQLPFRPWTRGAKGGPAAACPGFLDPA
ncbi:MAG: hypothetical protein K6360_02475, partial [Deltaproteobacteria bacterium]